MKNFLARFIENDPGIEKEILYGNGKYKWYSW